MALKSYSHTDRPPSCAPTRARASTDLSMLMAQRLKMEAVHSITSMVIRLSQMVVLRVHTPSWNWEKRHAQSGKSYPYVLLTYSSTVLKYSFEVSVLYLSLFIFCIYILYLSIFIFCNFILLRHRSWEILYSYLHYIYLTGAVTLQIKILHTNNILKYRTLLGIKPLVPDPLSWLMSVSLLMVSSKRRFHF